MTCWILLDSRSSSGRNKYFQNTPFPFDKAPTLNYAMFVASFARWLPGVFFWYDYGVCLSTGNSFILASGKNIGEQQTLKSRSYKVVIICNRHAWNEQSAPTNARGSGNGVCAKWTSRALCHSWLIKAHILPLIYNGLINRFVIEK